MRTARPFMLASMSNGLLLVSVGLLVGVRAAEVPAGLLMNATTFYNTLHAQNAGRWFLFFFSPQCGHCHAMMPAWSELETRLSGVARLGAVDATVEKSLADRLDVHGFPTLMGIESGMIHEYDGGRSADEMLAFIRSEDLKTSARESRPLLPAPTPYDLVLEAPAASVEILAFAIQTNALAAAMLTVALCSLGYLLAQATRQFDAQFITVECPAGVQPGQTFAVEFLTNRRSIWLRGRRRVVEVQAPVGIVAGQTFFVPLVAPPQVRPVTPPRRDTARPKQA